LQEIEAPRFLDSRLVKVVRLSVIRTGGFYPPGNIPGIHFCYLMSRTKAHSAVGRIMSMKYSNDTIDNRTRGLPAFSVVPQPTAPPRAPFNGFDASNSSRDYGTYQTEISIVMSIQKRKTTVL
jgi:hypothetical protein